MRYRKLDENGDMQFGNGSGDYLVNVPEAVGQAIQTRLLLIEGEWFVDITSGTPYQKDILGAHTQLTRDLAIRDRILGTQGVTSLLEYSSGVDPNTRKFSVTGRVDTIYGIAQIKGTL